MKLLISQSALIGLLLVSTSAFNPCSTPSYNRKPTKLGVAMNPETLQGLFEQDEQSYAIAKEDAGALIKFGKADKEKIINSFGIWCAVVSVLSGAVWFMALAVVELMSKVNVERDPNKANFDATGKVWANSWLHLINSYPTVSGNIKQLKEQKGPCLYVANHASWLDIAVLCTVLESEFKFIAKGELRKVPCIGQQLVWGKHILIDREDRKSQLRTFREGIDWLNKGVPIMAFPEGKRSKDGRLMEFKKGIFSLAMKANVPIIPITLSHTNAVMPSYSLLPVQSGAGKVHVHVNEAISPEGKNEADLEQLVRKAFLNTLPNCQLPPK